MAALKCGKGPLGGATLSKKHIPTDTSILPSARSSGKPAAARVEYVRAFVAPLCRHRLEVYIKACGALKSRSVLMVASVAGAVPRTPSREARMLGFEPGRAHAGVGGGRPL